MVVVLGAENLAVVYEANEDEDENREETPRDKMKRKNEEASSTKSVALDGQTS